MSDDLKRVELHVPAARLGLQAAAPTIEVVDAAAKELAEVLAKLPPEDARSLAEAVRNLLSRPRTMEAKLGGVAAVEEHLQDSLTSTEQVTVTVTTTGSAVIAVEQVIARADTTNLARFLSDYVAGKVLDQLVDHAKKVLMPLLATYVLSNTKARVSHQVDPPPPPASARHMPALPASFVPAGALVHRPDDKGDDEP